MKPLNFMRVFLVFIFAFVCVLLSSSQTVLILDGGNSKPIYNVAVFNPSHTHTALSNIYGIADISNFDLSDTVIFQHASYESLTLMYNEIVGEDFNISLKKKSVALNEIIISATRFEQDEKDIPNKIISISAKNVEFENPQTVADMLAGSGEVFVQKSQLGGGSPMIRGFSANKVLIVVDGVRMNNAIFRSGNLQNVIAIDPNSLSRTEVIFGPGTVIYGSDALGGVMNFMTLDPKLSPDGKFVSSVNLMARYSSANTERTGHLDVSLAGKKWSSVTSFSSSWFDDLQMGSNGPDEYLRKQYVETQDYTDYMVNNTKPEMERFTGYNQLNLLQKFRYQPNKNIDFVYGFHYSETSDVPRYDRLLEYENSDTLKYASWYYGPQTWMMNVLNSTFKVNCRMITELKVGLAWQAFEESRHSRKFSNPWTKNQYEVVDMYTGNIDIVKRLDDKNTFFYGFEGIFNDVKSTAVSENFTNNEEREEGTRYPDGTNHYSSFAAYLNYERQFNDRLTLFAGLRYTYVKLHSTFADTSIYHFPFDEISINTDAFNGSVGISWNPAAEWQFRLNLSSGFRAPNLDDAGKVFDSSPGNVVVPNPDLKPEYAYSIDGGIQRKLGEVAVLELSAFYTFVEDVMVRRDFTFDGMDSIWYDGEFSRVEAIVNGGSANIYGLSASGILNMGEFFKLSTNISWARGDDDEGYALRHVAPLFGNAALIFSHGPFLAQLYANYNGAIPYSRLAPTERDKPYMYATDSDGKPYSPAWWTLNFKASYDIIEQLSLDIGIENILNQRYRSYSSGIVSPGRNYIIALRARL